MRTNHEMEMGYPIFRQTQLLNISAGVQRMVCSPLKATIPFVCQQKLSFEMLNNLFKLKSLSFQKSRFTTVLEPLVGQLNFFTLTCSLAFAVAWQHARSLCCALSATATAASPTSMQVPARSQQRSS